VSQVLDAADADAVEVIPDAARVALHHVTLLVVLASTNAQHLIVVGALQSLSPLLPERQ
jgi:hypothetical protein